MRLPVSSVSSFCRFFFAPLIPVCAPASSLRVQPATGTIEGRVVNLSSGEYLENARITLESTNLETASVSLASPGRAAERGSAGETKS